jgi:hypothetical protein
MLEKAGISVDMVLLSTRDHGFVRKEVPMRRQFNYVVCAVRLKDQTLLLDATEKYLPFNVLPERCLNGEGLIISALNYGWLELRTNSKSRTVIIADLNLQPSGELQGKLNFTRSGYDADRMRRDYAVKGEEKYTKDLFSGKLWEVKKSEFQDIKDIEQSTKEIHELNISEHSTMAGDVIYLNPFVTSQLESNPFKLEKREYPVDFGSPIEKVYICKLSIPEGYAIDEIPKSKMFVLPGNAAKYLYNVTQTGNQISITSNMQINKNLFVQDEYLNLREFYNQVVAKQAEQIVLKKK